ncbi:MAG: lipopolysaccharide heptosyltransferase II [Gammaproteobacteria bacterium]|nr:MAG: lipopolysaccharide heptosyltransferase II [Gammaproteobacteria bacterium]
MVMVQSLFIALKRQNPGNIIDVVAPAWSAPVLARMPEVRQVIKVNLQHGKLQIAERYRIGKSLRGEYDRAIILPRTFKSALIPYFAKIPKRIAYRGEMRYGVVNEMRELDTELTYKAVEKYLHLAADPEKIKQAPQIYYPQLMVDEKKRHQTAKKVGVDELTPSIAFMPGAEFGPSKQWPGKYFGELAIRFKQQGYNVYVYGSQKDNPIGEEIAQASNGDAVNLCGQTNLEEAIDLLSLVKVAVTNDSGLMHIAAAVGSPVVAIYGAITPKYTPPLTDKKEIQYLGLECSPCWKKQCPFGHYNCLNNIEVDKVYESAQRLLEKEVATIKT